MLGNKPRLPRTTFTERHEALLLGLDARIKELDNEIERSVEFAVERYGSPQEQHNYIQQFLVYYSRRRATARNVREQLWEILYKGA